MSIPDWLTWARRLQALAQSGLAYCENKFDIQRYEELRDIASEMMAAGAARSDPTPIRNLFAAQSGYATPKIDVRVAAFRENRILLVRELSDGGWTLPGGWADVGEPPSLAAGREVREESGYEVRITKLAAFLDRDVQGHPAFVFHAYKAFFIAELTGGAAQDSHETAGAEFFPEDALPPLSLSRVLPRQITLMFDHHRNPTLPTAFD